MSSDWSVVKTGDIFDLINGYAFKSKEFVEYGAPVIKIKNVKAGYLTFDKLAFVEDRYLQSKLDKIVKKDDLLITMSGNRHDGSMETWVGKVAWFNEERDYLINQRIGILRLKAGLDINSRFIAYQLSCVDFQKHFISVATSSGGQANLSPDQIKNTEIKLPSRDIQDKIVSIVGGLEDKVRINSQTNQTLEQIAQAIFKSWFVDFEPVKAKIQAKQNDQDPERAAMCAISGKSLDELEQLIPEIQQQLKTTAALFPDALVESELGEIPVGWEVKCISDLGKVITGKTPPKKIENAYSEEGVPFITPTDIDESVFVTSTNRFLTDEGQLTVKKTKIGKGSICVTCIGSQMGKAIISPKDAFTNQQINSVVVSESYFRNYLLLNLRGRREEIFLIGSSGSTMPIINKSTFEKLSVISPSVDLLKQFDSAVVSSINKILKGALENLKLGDVRDLILPKLLSGKLEVPELAGVE